MRQGDVWGKSTFGRGNSPYRSREKEQQGASVAEAERVSWKPGDAVRQSKGQSWEGLARRPSEDFASSLGDIQERLWTTCSRDVFRGTLWLLCCET